MSDKFDKFKAALNALCDEHQVTIAPSNYDDIQIYDRDIRDGAIYRGIEDRTKQDLDG